MRVFFSLYILKNIKIKKMKQVKQIAKTLTMMMISLDLNAISLSEYINVSHTPLNLIHTLTLVFNRVI